MGTIKLSKQEHKVMEFLWSRGEASIREIHESFSEKGRPGYTTIQTVVYRLEAKSAVKRVRKLGNFHIFAATVSREAAQKRLIDELLSILGGDSRPVMAHLIDAGKLTMDDVEFAEKTLKSMKKRMKA